MDEASAEKFLTVDETLESLIQASKTPAGRSHLAADLPLPILLRLLALSRHPLLLPRLRLLRNLCAGEFSVQTSFIRSNGADSLTCALLGPPRAPPEALRVGLQVLGNVALAGDEHREVVWAHFFPGPFLELARVRGPQPGVCDPLCMVLDTCCSSEGGRRRLHDLVGDVRGLEIVAEIIRTASQEGYKEEWLEWFLTKLCIEESYISEVFAKLGSLGGSDTSDGPESHNIMFTAEQAFLLYLLSKCLSERPREVMVSNEFGLEVLKILTDASGCVDFSSRGSSELPTDASAIDVLGYSLLLLRDICAWENHSSGGTEPPINALLSAGILELVLSLLCELEPPLIVKKSIARAKEQGVQPVGAETMKVCPYKGYRRDLVSVICNCLRGRKQVQDEIRQKNGILLLLQQCVIDEDNSFLREWGVLAIGYLLEGNPENQHEVAELQLQEPIQTPEIANLGLKVEVDGKSGRAKLVNMSQVSHDNMRATYVVFVGRQPGLYEEWFECSRQVTNYKGAIYKKYNNKLEAEAAFLEFWGSPYNVEPSSSTGSSGYGSTSTTSTHQVPTHQVPIPIDENDKDSSKRRLENVIILLSIVVLILSLKVVFG